MFHLALSKNKNFWDNSITNIYLGPWMMPEVLKDEFPEYKLILPEWPWDDLDKFFNDNLKVWNEYEKFIEKLSNVLNELHGLDWNIKAWKILVGPWLRRYLSIICERNETISSLYSSYDLRSCTIMDHSFLDLQVKDFDDFSKSYHDNNFNNIIYSHYI